MSPESTRAPILKRLLDGARISKEILTTALLMFHPEGIVEKLEAHYKAINDLFIGDFNRVGFLDSTEVLNQLPDYNNSRVQITSMVSIVNIALATYKLFAETDLDKVLKSIFTNIVPVHTDILQHVVAAYTELLHKVAIETAPVYPGNAQQLISAIKPTRPDAMTRFNQQLDSSESTCLTYLTNGKIPMIQDEFIMLWERAFNSMIRQSRDIRDTLMFIPTELLRAPNSSSVVETNNNNSSAATTVNAKTNSPESSSNNQYIESDHNEHSENMEVQTERVEDDEAYFLASENLEDEIEAERMDSISHLQDIEDNLDDNGISKELEVIVVREEQPVMQNVASDNGSGFNMDPNDTIKENGDNTGAIQPPAVITKNIVAETNQSNNSDLTRPAESSTIRVHTISTIPQAYTPGTVDEYFKSGASNPFINNKKGYKRHRSYLNRLYGSYSWNDANNANRTNTDNDEQMEDTATSLIEEKLDSMIIKQEPQESDDVEALQYQQNESQDIQQDKHVEEDNEAPDEEMSNTSDIFFDANERLSDIDESFNDTNAENGDVASRDNSNHSTLIPHACSPIKSTLPSILLRKRSIEETIEIDINNGQQLSNISSSNHEQASSSSSALSTPKLISPNYLPTPSSPNKSRLDGEANTTEESQRKKETQPRIKNLTFPHGSITKIVTDFFKTGATNAYINNKKKYKKPIPAYAKFFDDDSWYNDVGSDDDEEDSITSDNEEESRRMNVDIENQRGVESSKDITTPLTPTKTHIPSPNTQASSRLTSMKRRIDASVDTDVNNRQLLLNPSSSALSTPPSPKKKKLANEANAFEENQHNNELQATQPSTTDIITNPTIPEVHPPRTVEEFMNSDMTSPFISKKSRYRTSLFEAGSYTRRRAKKNL